ncbi:MAG: hypothetical protein QME88_05635 [Actinomycetota bacterium]|nr:hypothetical protein [Actinomycetota bacterium]
MRAEDLLVIMRRIVRDFSPLLPGMRLEVVSAEAFRARLQGRPLLPGEVLNGTRRYAPPEGGSRDETYEEARDETREEAPPPYPLHAFPSTRVVMVDVEGVRTLIGGEDRRLQRVLVEGMILREVIYLATSRQPLPDPRGRAETIFRRHWPFQYAALRGAGFLGGPHGLPRGGRELAGEN